MNRIFALAACLLVSFLSATAADRPAAPITVRDRLWSWSVDASFDWPAHEAGETPGKNRMTPVEGAVYLGVPNVMFIQYQGIPPAPFEQYFTPFKAMQQVFWTLSNNGNQVHQLGKEQEHVFQLVAAHQNITGLLLDDFFIGPINPKDDSHWLAENNVAFPVSLTLQWPQAVEADALQLTQSDWPDGGYLTGKFVVDVSNDGTQWQEIIAGEMPDEAGVAKKLDFPARALSFLRVRVLSSLDAPVAMSAMSCGLKGVTLMHKVQPIALTGTQFQASSEYPGHEAGKLESFNPAKAGQPKAFSSQVSPLDLAEAKRRMQNVGGRKLDLAVVVYSNQLDEGIVPILKDVDVVLFWTWKSSDLRHLERNLRRLKELLPGKRVILGCYLWDFSNGQLMPLELMQKQSDLGLAWLKSGEIEGMIFLGSNIMDKNLKAVEWTREWIAKVGKEVLK